MMTQGTGPGDELDLESILNEFCPEEQVNTAWPRDGEADPEHPPRIPENPAGTMEHPAGEGETPHPSPEEPAKRAAEAPKAAQTREKPGEKPVKQEEPPAEPPSKPRKKRFGAGKQVENPAQGEENPSQEVENPLRTPREVGVTPRKSGETPHKAEETPRRGALEEPCPEAGEKLPEEKPEAPTEKAEKPWKKWFRWRNGDEAKSEPETEVPRSPSAPQPTSGPKIQPEPPGSAMKKPKKKIPKSKEKAENGEKPNNIVEFPGQEMGLTQRLSRLRQKGDRYAEGMFAGDEDPDTQELRREKLLPGVDYEDELTHAPTPRKRRVVHHPKPDLTAAQLAGKYKRGLGFLRTRVFLAFVMTLAQIYLLLAQGGVAPIPAALRQGSLLPQLSAVLLGVSALIGVDVLLHGLLGIFKLRFELETVLLLAVVATAADAVTMPLLNLREGAMPYTAAASAAIFFALWGRCTKRKAQRMNVRTVAGRKEPYLVTLDEKVWNGEDAYMKWSGDLTGFGSQVQDTDGAQRAYHRAAPVILLVALTLTLFASVGAKRPENFFWCLSATLLAGCGFSGFLAFAEPYHALVTRLSKVGAALGGWDSLRWTGRNRGVVVTDGDLFPPGAVKLNGIKLIGDMLSLETAVSYVATLVRETGSGMEKPFSDMMRSQGGLFRRASRVVCHEGGVTGIIGGENVVVGSAGFLELMGIEPPPGLRVKNAVFLGVDGQLAAIFALNYRLHPTVQYALDSLLANHLDPILATRDFLVIPEMLEKRFKLKVDQMEFPSLDRRRELSSKRSNHDENIAALLCREGLSPYAEAVVGGKRLVGATRAGVFFSLLGSAVGMLLAFYLTLAQAYASISAGSLLIFLLLWLVPAILIAGWADRY